MKTILAILALLVSGVAAADSLVDRVEQLEKRVGKLEASITSWSCQGLCYVYDDKNTYQQKVVLSDGDTGRKALENLWLECEGFMHEMRGKVWSMDQQSMTPNTYKGSIKNNCSKN